MIRWAVRFWKARFTIHHCAHALNGSIVTDPFPLNAVPKTRLDPVALAIQNLVPAPTNSALINNYVAGYVGIRHTDINSIKVDQILTSKSAIRN